MLSSKERLINTETLIIIIVSKTAYFHFLKDRSSHMEVIRLNSKALVTINELTLRRALLVLGWVTVCRRVNLVL